ncbi:hypothetical protein MASR2M117_00070 [Paludibacter sp.]
MKKVIVTCVVLLGCMSIFSTNRYVADAEESGTGLSWSDPKTTISAAINAAAAGDTIFVAAGVHEFATPLTLSKAITIMGGYLVEEDVATRPLVENGKPWEFAYPTILRGLAYTGTGTNTDLKNSRILHINADNIELNGLLFEDGGGKHTASNELGGAIYSAKLGFNVRNCSFVNNGVTRIDNGSGGLGGAMYLNGAGVVENCYFTGNYADKGASGGGALFLLAKAEQTITVDNCLFDGNKSNVSGAGIRTNGATGGNQVYVRNSVFVKNEAKDGDVLKGGAVIYFNGRSGADESTDVIENCLFYNNTGTTIIRLRGGIMRNSTAVNNIGTVQTAGTTVELYNNLIWGNKTSADELSSIDFNTGPAIMKNCASNNIKEDFAGEEHQNILLGADNIGEDGPHLRLPTTFVGAGDLSEETPDWRLGAESPLKAAGLTTNAPATDILGKARTEATSSIGAYEYEEIINDGLINPFASSDLRMFVQNKTLYISLIDEVAVQVLSINGQVLAQSSYSTHHNFSLMRGLYLVSIVDKSGKKFTNKVLVP